LTFVIRHFPKAAWEVARLFSSSGGNDPITSAVSKSQPYVTAPVIMLDGQPLPIPHGIKDSVTSLLSFLETEAMQRGRILASVLVDGMPVDVLLANNATMGFQRVAAATMSPLELGRMVVHDCLWIR
jgi:hypothetical protein